MVSIKLKLLVVSLFVSLVPLLILGIINLNETSFIISESMQDSLSTIVHSKEAALESYVIRTEKTAQGFADMAIMQEFVTYLNRDLSPKETEEFEKVKKQVDDLLFNYMESYWGVEYHHIMVADLNGAVISSPNHGNVDEDSYHIVSGQDLSENPWFEPALTSTQVSDFSTWAESTHYHQVLMHPIKDSEGTTHAVIVFELMISHENNILSDGFKLGETGKVYLSTLEGVPVVHLKEELQPALDSEGIKESIDKGMAIGHSKNELGVPIIGYYLKSEKYPWIMVAEIEEKEAFKNLDIIKTQMMTGFFVTVLLVVFLVLVFSYYLVNPLGKLTSAVKKIAGGEMDTKLPVIKTKDEVQELTSVMEMLVSSIKFLKKGKR